MVRCTTHAELPLTRKLRSYPIVCGVYRAIRLRCEVHPKYMPENTRRKLVHAKPFILPMPGISMPRKKYWKGISFTDRKQHERQRDQKRAQYHENEKINAREEKRKLLHEPKKLFDYIKRAPTWDVLVHFTIPELFSAQVRPEALVRIVHDNLIPCYYPERMRNPPSPDLIMRSKRTTLHALFPFGVPMEVLVLMRQKHPEAILFEELVAWSLLNTGTPSEKLASNISTEALHTVLSHHPAYRRNIPPSAEH